MWYNAYTLKKTPNCSQCGSTLIFVSKVTEKVEGSFFPQTTIVYRCSNKECQDQKDQHMAKRYQIRKDKEIADQKRADEKLKTKMSRMSS